MCCFGNTKPITNRLLFVNLPTILCPSSVLKRTICILTLVPLTEASTPSTLVHTLRTEPQRTKYVLQRSPISHCNPTEAFLQFPRLFQRSPHYSINQNAVSDMHNSNWFKCVWVSKTSMYQYACEQTSAEELYWSIQCCLASSDRTWSEMKLLEHNPTQIHNKLSVSCVCAKNKSCTKCIQLLLDFIHQSLAARVKSIFDYKLLCHYIQHNTQQTKIPFYFSS